MQRYIHQEEIRLFPRGDAACLLAARRRAQHTVAQGFDRADEIKGNQGFVLDDEYTAHGPYLSSVMSNGAIREEVPENRVFS